MNELHPLIRLAKEQGCLKKSQIIDSLPGSITDADQIEDIVCFIADLGIEVVDDAGPSGKA
jgi:HKD family nuclease